MATIEYINNGRYYEVCYGGNTYGCTTLDEAKALADELNTSLIKFLVDKIKRAVLH